MRRFNTDLTVEMALCLCHSNDYVQYLEQGENCKMHLLTVSIKC